MLVEYLLKLFKTKKEAALSSEGLRGLLSNVCGSTNCEFQILGQLKRTSKGVKKVCGDSQDLKRPCIYRFLIVIDTEKLFYQMFSNLKLLTTLKIKIVTRSAYNAFSGFKIFDTSHALNRKGTT